MFRSVIFAAALLSILIVGHVASQAVSAQTPSAASADERLRDLYTEEWTWRQKEALRGGGGDRFPRVDAASQQARLACWTKTLAAVDAIPFDQLSAEEKIKQIRRHRREAEEQLGVKFDQRRFHDTILAIGSVPLPVLEQHMAQFIAEETTRSRAGR